MKLTSLFLLFVLLVLAGCRSHSNLRSQNGSHSAISKEPEKKIEQAESKFDHQLGPEQSSDAESQYQRGVEYYHGAGVSRDYSEACKWFKLAAEKGHSGAQYSLGMRYVLGEGVTKDEAEACKWLKLAAEQGNTSAQYSLAMRYTKGEGIPKDYAEAVKWYTRAAEKGIAAAQYSLAWRYFEGGQGVSKNYVEAYKWFTLATDSGSKSEAIRDREDLMKLMTPEEIAEGKRRADEFSRK